MKKKDPKRGKRKEKPESVIESTEALQEKVLGVESWVEKNSKLIVIISVFLAIILGGSYAYRYYLSNQEAKAQSQLFYPQIWLEQDSLDIALNGKNLISGFKDIANKYSNTKAGQLAKYYVGVIHLKKGEYYSVIEQLSDISFDDHLLSVRIKALLGDAYAESEDYDMAIKYYLEASETSPNPTITLQYIKKTAILYEFLEQKEKAIDLYKKTINEFPKAFMISNIKKELSRLTGKAYY